MRKAAVGDWIACEAGTQVLSVWAMQEARPVASAHAKPTGEGLEADLLRLVEDWLDPDRTVDIVTCGTSDVALQPVPAKPLDLPAHPVPTQDRRIALSCLPGLSQARPPAIMQGPETRIAGFLSLNAGWDGVICLTGTQTVWAQISAGEVVSFQCFLTPGLLQALIDDPLLAHCGADAGWHEAAFAAAIDDAMARPERLAADLAGIAARHRLTAQAPAIGRAQLWGLAVGAELAAARPYWLGQHLAVLGETEAAGAYHRALSLQGAPAIIADETAMLLAGIRARARLA